MKQRRVLPCGSPPAAIGPMAEASAGRRGIASRASRALVPGPDQILQRPGGCVGAIRLFRSGRSGLTGKPPSRDHLRGRIAAEGPSVFRSTDAGATWEPLAGQPSARLLPHHGVLSARGVLTSPMATLAGPHDGGVRRSRLQVRHGDLAMDVVEAPVRLIQHRQSGFARCRGSPSTRCTGHHRQVTSTQFVVARRHSFRSTTPARPGRDGIRAAYPARSASLLRKMTAEAPWLDWGTIKTPPGDYPESSVG